LLRFFWLYLTKKCHFISSTKVRILICPFQNAWDFKASRRKCRPLAEALHDGRWILDLRGRVTADSLSEFVDLWGRVQRVTLVHGIADSFVWRFFGNGVYSSKSAYRLQFAGVISSP
jgi:fermentation-respiration switch protein FrsA (DUF1100 family)